MSNSLPILSSIVEGPLKRTILNKALEVASPGCWSQPLAFEIPDESKALEAPLWVLPSALASLVQRVSAAKQTPPENILAALLGCLSAICVGRYKAKLTQQYTTHCHVWILLALRTAGGKSEAVAVFLEAIRRAERQCQKLIQEQNDTHAQNRAKAAKRIGELEAGVDPEYLGELSETREILEKIKEKPLPSFAGKNTTPAKLDVVYAQRQIVSLVLTEAAEWLGLITGKNKDQSADLASVLSGYSVEPCGSDRVGRGESVCQRPCLSLFLAVQDHVLEELVKDKVARDRGFIGRCLIVKGNSWVGHRLPYDQRPPLSAHDKEPWERVVHAITGSIPPSDRDGWLPFQIPVTDEASHLHSRLFEVVERRLTTDSPDLQLLEVEDIASRVLENVSRLAVLIHILWATSEDRDPAETPITEACVFRGFCVALWSLAGFFELDSNKGDHKNALDLWKAMSKHHLFDSGSCSMRKWLRGAPTRWRSQATLTPALGVLEDLGYVQVDSLRNEKGSSSKVIILNPGARHDPPQILATLATLSDNPLFTEVIASYPRLRHFVTVCDTSEFRQDVASVAKVSKVDSDAIMPSATGFGRSVASVAAFSGVFRRELSVEETLEEVGELF